MKLDLHGKTWAEAKAEFIEVYNGVVGRDTLDVVHGYGSTGVGGGVLRERLRAFLARYPGHVTCKHGEQLDGNPGHTVVVPVKRLPTLEDQLAEDIWDYCAEPRTLSKVMGKFRRHGDPRVREAIGDLVAQRRLRRNGDSYSQV